MRVFALPRDDAETAPTHTHTHTVDIHRISTQSPRSSRVAGDSMGLACVDEPRTQNLVSLQEIFTGTRTAFGQIAREAFVGHAPMFVRMNRRIDACTDHFTPHLLGGVIRSLGVSRRHAGGDLREFINREAAHRLRTHVSQ